MPFTFSHPAIVLSLSRFSNKWFSLTGLIIGSIIPDFEYFIRMKPYSEYSHTLGGIFWFDLPLALMVAFVFHNIVRNNLYDNLPECLRLRFSAFRHFGWNRYFLKNWIIVLISILIGIFSHLFWDSFTHQEAFFVQRISFLETTVHLYSIQVPVFKILQHLSTLVGAIIIVFVIWKMPKYEISTLKVNLWYWFILLLLSLGIILISLLTGLDYKLYGSFIVSCISAFMIALILTPLLMRKI